MAEEYEAKSRKLDENGWFSSGSWSTTHVGRHYTGSWERMCIGKCDGRYAQAGLSGSAISPIRTATASPVTPSFAFMESRT
jgi:hypothetical protein